MRIHISFISAALLLCTTSACGDSSSPQDRSGSSAETTYATTSYSFRAILEPVVGERGRVTHLLPSGASAHTYDPRPSDVRTASSARALFYGAPELDQWAARLGGARGIALIDLLPDSLILELPRDGDAGGGHEHGHGSGRDPHFWMDPLRVAALMPALADTLCAHDRPSCSTYRSNAAEFSGRLRALHDSVQTVVEPLRGKALLLSHPFIQYFADRYRIRIAGVIEEMPGSEPTARDMERIIRSARQSGAGAIVTLPQLPDRAARIVSETAGIPIVVLDPNGGVEGRTTYEELILYNAHALRRGIAQAD